MTQDLFVFNKSFEDRMDDFNYILNSSLKTADIKEEWSTFTEFTIEPVGWRAIWKMSRSLCSGLNVEFPCTVIVIVQQINFRDLSCTGTINEVEDGSASLPPMMSDIPLVELYPTIEQDNNIVLSKLLETAKIIDSLRFFYHHLWMPWDVDNDEGNSWVASHLEGRLKLHFALLEHKVPNKVANDIHNIVTEGRRIQSLIEDMQDQISEEMEVDGFATRLLELTELHNRMSILRNQYSIYEKPVLLEAFIKRAKMVEQSQQENKNSETVSYVVLKTCTPEQLGRLAEMTLESKIIRTFQTLQEALVTAPANAIVSLLQGKHPVHVLGNFENGGTVKGMEPNTVLTEDRECPSGWNLLHGNLTFANLKIQMNSVWNIIKVRPEAECNMQDVILEGASVTDAIDVFPGAKLVANNCHFSNCRTAVVCDNNSTVMLINCTFDSNIVAIEVKEGCHLIIEDCIISNSKKYGINIMLTARGNKSASKSVSSIPGLKESGITYKNNAMDYHFSPPPLKQAEDLTLEGDFLSASR